MSWIAAIPGDIPHIGTVGTVGWVPSPRHYARNARKGPSESASGPAPKPRSRACPSARSRPPRVSAPVGTPARSPVATVSSAGRTDPTTHAPEAAPPRQPSGPLAEPSSRCREWLEHLDLGGDDRGESAALGPLPRRCRLVRPPPRASGAVPHHRRPRRAGRIPADRRRGAGRSRGPRGPACPPPATAIRSPTHPPKRLSDRANRKNGRPYGPLWAFRRMSGGEPDIRGNRDRALPVSGRSRKRSVK